MSSAASVDAALRDYLAGKMPAERFVAVVAGEYYQKRAVGSGEWLRPVIDIIERAHPGFVELRGTADKPGFAVRLQERPFPRQWESAIRAAAEEVASTKTNHSPLPTPSFLTRIVRAIRQIFSA